VASGGVKGEELKKAGETLQVDGFKPEIAQTRSKGFPPSTKPML
jgi:hypothetical protein